MESNSSIVIYESGDGQTKLDVQLDGETVWLTQAQIAELFDIDRTVVSRRLRNVYQSGELTKESTCANFAHMGSTGQMYQVGAYNLDAIISVGYRANSKRATPAFRQMLL